MRVRIAVHAARLLVASLLICEGSAQAKAQSRSGLAEIDGVVTDTSHALLNEVTVSLLGSTVNIATGANGRFRLVNVAPGRYILVARRIGFEAMTTVVEIAEGDALRLAFTMEQTGTLLDTVVVNGTRVPAKFSAFDARLRKHQASTSITTEDIAKRNPPETWEILSDVSSVRVAPSGRFGAVYPASNRGMQLDRNKRSAAPCYMGVMIDGVMTQPGVGDSAYDLKNLPPPNEIYGVEVFAGPASIPLEYNSNIDPTKICGLIAVWTK